MSSTIELIQLIKSLHGATQDISPDTSLTQNVGLTSVEVMELIEAVEDHFDIGFPLNKLENVKYVSDLAEIIDGLLKEQA